MATLVAAAPGHPAGYGYVEHKPTMVTSVAAYAPAKTPVYAEKPVSTHTAAPVSPTPTAAAYPEKTTAAPDAAETTSPVYSGAESAAAPFSLILAIAAAALM